MSFEWQTEEEDRWEKTAAADEERQPAPRRRWSWIVLLLAVTAAGLFFGWRAVQERVAEATELIQADVRSSHQLARQAARDGDQELFVTLLSGRSQSWTDAQRERLEQRLLFADTARLFGWRPADGQSQRSDVSLNADLTEAVLVAEELFVVRGRGDVTHTVALSQTAVYRQGNQRWLLSPPDSEFWGRRRNTAGRILRVVYPQRDEELALRLAEDIDATLEELCRTTINCPERMTVRLRLETDPRSVLLAGQPEAIFSAGDELTLPTPTLVGHPVDDASYEALARGYAGFVVTGMLLEATAYECCQGILFQQAIVSQQLAELGLRPSPVSSGDYARLLDAQLSADRLLSMWNAVTPAEDADSIPIEVHAFLDFVRQQDDATDNDLHNYQLALANGLSFWQWVSMFTGYEPGRPQVLEREWRAYTREQLLERQQTMSWPAGLSLPDQDLVAFCGGETLDVYRYRFRDDSWHMQLERDFGVGILASTPDDNGFFITGAPLTNSEAEQIETWFASNAGDVFRLGDGSQRAYVVFPWQVAQPEDGRMFAWLLDREGQQVPDSVLLDPQNCSEDGCPYETIAGLPLPAPDGGAVLYADINDMGVFLQREGETALEGLGRGTPMSWLDNEHFLLVKPSTSGRGQGLFVASVDEPAGRELVNAEALNQAINSPSPVSNPMRISWVGPDLSNLEQIVLIASRDAPAWESEMFVLTRSDPSQSWLEADTDLRWLDSTAGSVVSFGLPYFQPLARNRWLILPIHSEYSDRSGILLYDLQEKRVVLESPVGTDELFWGHTGDWSADEQWYVRNVPGALALIAPAFEGDSGPVRYMVPHDFQRCQSVAWMNPG